MNAAVIWRTCGISTTHTLDPISKLRTSLAAVIVIEKQNKCDATRKCKFKVLKRQVKFDEISRP